MSLLPAAHVLHLHPEPGWPRRHVVFECRLPVQQVLRPCVSLLVTILVWWTSPAIAQEVRVQAPLRDGQPLAIPTFHSLGLYWSPAGGAADEQVQARYRIRGDADWNEALPMRYNPIANTDEDLADYRGSIVHLQPATTYEVQMTLSGTSTRTQLTAATWSEDFPVGELEHVGSSDPPLVITTGGQPGAWRVYDGTGATIDVHHRHTRASPSTRRT